MIDMKRYCSPYEPARAHLPDLRIPFFHNGWTYYLNDAYAIRVRNRQDSAGEPQKEIDQDVINKIFATPPEEINYIKVPRFHIPEKTRCEVCIGFGKTDRCEECGEEGVVVFENDFNHYQNTCKTCKGNCEIAGTMNPCISCDAKGYTYDFFPSEDWIEINDQRLSKKILIELMDLPLFAISKHSPGNNAARFIFHGGEGVIMQMRKDS